MTELADALAARIASDGPLRLDAWMAACNSHYYAAQDPLGRDFTTAPEVSQLFGEMIGGWIGDLWLRAGQPPLTLVELGPGRGTLMADALRLLARIPGFTPSLALVETSPTLRAVQATTLAQHPPEWHDDLSTLPTDTALIVIANEFFDALPIRQHLGQGQERAVGHNGERFLAATLPSPETTSQERNETGEALIATLAARLRAQGGAALIIDYGQSETAADTLQAIRAGTPHDPFSSPGEADLTAHVAFSALQHAANLPSHGPIPQGRFLAALGIHSRAAALSRGKPIAEAAKIAAGLARLTAPAQMGALFKAMALTSPGWPTPAGFDA
ncbi:NADH dehydrogenase [ubiquinone] 1 alpha subcomplex assembly factor 7 [Polymorphobacter multimanifer]|uniref:NADH dehydrogenase [ubiquinone] 1 alpha subcomplex assembly factor 7 n=2 Tax=Polymorphobacter multimanifer TaxID=1070431 RepID=A0A841L2A1_9SPHN|nr:SAM-dependent methyltransferase [Polymorphobacter multimanifer]MBB6226939.1 NADH dehydrogenase [ubiquinone] 1 alpha subcomplex assembly factor 7 [Polymorphobacter multimanifer]